VHVNGGWVGVDLDGTLAHYDEWRGPGHVGAPIPRMVERVKEWLRQGIEVRIVTARVSGDNEDHIRIGATAIGAWCVQHIGAPLPITNMKDFGMVELWDDRAVQVEKNTGRTEQEIQEDLDAAEGSPARRHCTGCGCTDV